MVDSETILAWRPTWQDAAILLVAVVACFKFKSWLKNRKLRLPPGPRGYPIVGNLPQLSAPIFKAFDRLGKEYGPIVYLKFGSIPVVVVQSVEYARDLFKTHDVVYSQRPRDTLGVHYLFHQGDGMSFLPNGEEWRNLRRVLTSNVLTRKGIRAFKDQRQELVLGAVGEMLNQSNQGTEVYLKEHLVTLMYNLSSHMVGAKVLQGRTASTISAEQAEFRTMVGSFFTLMTTFAVKDWFPFTRIFGDFQGLEKKMEKVAHHMDAFLQKSLDDHRKAKQQREVLLKLGYEGLEEEKEDFVDVLLKLEWEEGKPLTDRQRKIIMEPLFTGGTDSVSTSLMWTMAELCKHPEVLKKVQEEIDSVMGRDAPVREEDLGELKLLTAVIKETFRLHPNNSPFPRQGIEDCKLGGYDIPANARILVNIYTLMRDERYYPDPLVFRPERFLDPDNPVDFTGSNLEFLPFGSGRRRCAGMPMAIVEAQLVLANLLHLCDFSLPNGMKPEDIDIEEEPTAHLSNAMKTPHKVFLTPRLAPEFYKTYLKAGYAK